MQYGFVCVVTGAQQPVGQAIIQELAGESIPLARGTGRSASELEDVSANSRT